MGKRLALALAISLSGVFGLASAQERAPGGDKPAGEVLLRVPPGGTEVLVEELIRDIGERLHKIVAIDEAIVTARKKIKFHTSAELTFPMLVELLRFYGYELVFKKVDGREILAAYMQRTAAQQAKVMPTPLIGEGDKMPETPQLVTAVYTFKYADPNGAQNVIRVMQGQDPRRLGNVFLVPGTPTIVITDLTNAAEFYLDICRRLDSPVPELTYKIVQVHYALADELAQLVNELHAALATGAAPGQGAQLRRPAGAKGAPAARGAAGKQPGQVVADVRTNKLVILALPEEVAKIERMIRELDVKVEPPPRHFHVYKCVNANALDLAYRLNALFGGAQTGFSSQSASRRQSARDRRSSRRGTSRGRGPLGNALGNLNRPTSRPRRTPSVGGAGAAVPGSQLNPGEGAVETRIVPDEQTNSLLIQANPHDYREILAILEELDKKRLRVLVEAQVWEISVSDDLFFAVDSALTEDASTNRNPNPLRGHALSNFGLLTVSDPTFSDPSTIGLIPNVDPSLGGTLLNGGLVALLTKGGFDRVPLIVQALARESSANLVTSPFTMVNDGETASFTIEQTVPFQVATSTSVSAFQGFDQATATSMLEITPRIASGTNLTLDIALDIESFGEQASPLAPPESQLRSYQGTVTVPNQSYIVFGGLEQEVMRESRRKIPVLGDIPVLGYLFGSTSWQKERRRIYVFVRPVIFAHEDFSGEKKAARFMQTNVRAESLLGDRVEPILPDDVVEAEMPGARSVLYGLFDREGALVMPEDARTRERRNAILRGRATKPRRAR